MDAKRLTAEVKTASWYGVLAESMSTTMIKAVEAGMPAYLAEEAIKTVMGMALKHAVIVAVKRQG